MDVVGYLRFVLCLCNNQDRDLETGVGQQIFRDIKKGLLDI
jgi:hypothetical protein